MNWKLVVGGILSIIAGALWFIIILVIESDRSATGAAIISGWLSWLAIPASVLAGVLLSQGRKDSRDGKKRHGT